MMAKKQRRTPLAHLHTAVNWTSLLAIFLLYAASAQTAQHDRVEILTHSTEKSQRLGSFVSRDIMNAVRNGSAANVRELLDDHVAREVLDATGADGSTALTLAVDHMRGDIIGALLEAGASVDKVDGQDATALCLAAGGGNISIVRQLLDAGADANNNGEAVELSPLHMAVAFNHLDIVNLLASAGADVHTLDHDGQSLVYVAVERGHGGSLIPHLANLGVDVNVPDRDGFYPLHMAGRRGDGSAIDALMEHGADVNVRDIAKNTVVGIAAHEGHAHLVEALVAVHGANLELGDIHGATPLHTTATRCLAGGFMLQKLLTLGAYVDAKDIHMSTPLHLAAQRGHLKCIDALLAAGATATLADDQGRTPAMLADYVEKPQVSEYIDLQTVKEQL